MEILLYIVLATFLLSTFSLIGVLFLYFNEKFLRDILLGLVAFSTGTLLGGAFLHLLPEALESLEPKVVFGIVLFAFFVFFIVEKVLHWRHCHEGHCDVHSFGYMNLIGDSIHNFIDGLIIAAGFLVSIPLGITTTLGLAFHEIPQEISDFGVLVYSGMDKKKALWFNFIVATTSVLGGVVGYFVIMNNQNIAPYLLPFAAGGFIYIATSDLMPELRKHNGFKHSLFNISMFLAGILFMWTLTFWE